MKRWVEIKDPVHGYIEFSEPEIAVIDTPQFQRLRRLRQLSAAHLTYPGAEHTRFHHSLGVLHIAGKIAQRFQRMGLITEEEHDKLRLAGLLHDIGHGPFSHLFEEVLEKRNLNHEQMSTSIIQETEVADKLNEYGFDPDEMGYLAVGKLQDGKGFMNQVIAGQFSADVLDYLPRDSHFTGVEYGKVDYDRLVRSMDVIDDRLSIKDTALYVLEAMVIARYEMFKAVYFHRSVRSAETMLVRALELGDEALGFTSFNGPDEYHRLDDGYVLHKLATLKGSDDPHSKTAYQLYQDFNDRRLLKCAYETVMHRRDRFNVNMMIMGTIRDNLEADIATEAGVDRDYVIIDVSTAPSVPYYAMQQHPQDIPLFHETPEGDKVPLSFSELSPLGGALVGYLDIMRVYTRSEYHEAVRKAAEAKFGQESAASKISF
ncbi:MAG: HD domain-containing protein [Candidatus Bathyarchaeota archaeon]|nr:HD domain-containing protein [Candidatus Bathyarchaeota archaeon]